MIDRKEEARREEQRQVAAAAAATERLTRRYRLAETPPGTYRRAAWLSVVAVVVVGLAIFELLRPTPEDIIEAIADNAPLPRCEIAQLATLRLRGGEDASEAAEQPRCADGGAEASR